jgi:GT2 family glycosyltransferase
MREREIMMMKSQRMRGHHSDSHGIDLSIVIVTWNTRDLLLQCIRTIQQTTREHSLEIIVVDNASVDGSVEAVRGLSKVTVLCNEENKGFAAANNRGIHASNGKYICLVNSDVEVLEPCLDRMCNYMDENPKVGLLGPKVLNKDLTLQRSCAELPSVRNTLTQALVLDRVFPKIRWLRNRFMNDFSHDIERDVDVLSGCFIMARRDGLEQVGLLDERFFIYKEDVDWCKRFGDAGWAIRFFPEAKAIHYGGASSAVAPAKFLIEMEKANLQYWRKHHTWLGQAAARVAVLAHYWTRMCGWTLIHLVKPGKDVRPWQMTLRYTACLRWLLGASAALRR